MKLNNSLFYVLCSRLVLIINAGPVNQGPAPLLRRANFDSKGTLLLWKRITACEGSLPDTVQSLGLDLSISSKKDAWWSFPWLKKTKPVPPTFGNTQDPDFQSAYWGLQEYTYFHVPEIECFEAGKNMWCNPEDGMVYEVNPLSDVYLKVDYFDIDSDMCHTNVWLEESFFSTVQPTQTVLAPEASEPVPL